MVYRKSMTQSQALSILKTGANVFLTGEPGAGKTHTVNEYVAYLRACGIEPAITASTGIAATHIGGMTIHSWSGIGIRRELSKYDLERISSNEYVAKRISRAKVLIIDEISMLSPQMLNMVDAVCREVKRTSEPFGGLQVVLVGDFFQLPPIVNKQPVDDREQTIFFEEPVARFAYDAPAWARANLIVCYLAEQYRQDDPLFLSMLTAIRRNEFAGGHLQHLEKRKIQRHLAPAGVPKLFSHNIDVDRVNGEMLESLPGAPKVFSMSSQGADGFVATLKKGCLSPAELHLKVGAAVMFTKNNPKGGFANGTLGTVEVFSRATGYPIIRLRDKTMVKVEPVDWMVEENGKIRARITQFPLRLAWAITVHKSQGMSLDEAVMDLSDVFEFGQGYVALSRVRRLSGLHLLGWNDRALQVHPEVIEKDQMFRALSEEAQEAFSKLPLTELKDMQHNFVVACGGDPSAGDAPVSQAKTKKVKAGAKLASIREHHPNAYRSWGKAQDEMLRDLFAQDVSIGALAKKFGRGSGAIRSRLVRLGLIDGDDSSIAG